MLAGWDEAAGLWFVKATNIVGLVVEAESLEQFRQVICNVAGDLIDHDDDHDDDRDGGDIPIWVKAEAIARAKRHVAEIFSCIWPA